MELLESRLSFAADFLSEGQLSLWQEYSASQPSAIADTQWLSAHLGAASPGGSSFASAIIGFPPQQEFDAFPMATTDGGHLLIFRVDLTGVPTVFARYTNSDGSPGPEPFIVTQLNTATTTQLGTPSPTNSQDPWEISGVALSDGTVVVIWSDETGLFGQRIQTNGEKLGSPIEIAAGLPVSRFRTVATALSDETFVVAWYDDAYGEMRAGHYTHDGVLLDEHTISLPQDMQRGPSRMSLREIAVGEFAVSWIIESDMNSGMFYEQTYIAGTATDLESFTLPSLDNIDIVRLEQGGWGVVGERLISNDREIVLQIIDESGTLLSERTLGRSSLGVTDEPRIVPLPDGEWLVSYFLQSDSFLHFNYQLFNRDGEPIGEPQTLDVLLTAPRGAILALAQDTFATYWQGSALDGFNDVVMAQSLRLWRTPLIVAMDENLKPDEYALSIQGIPATAGLNAGSLQADGSWIVGLDQLQSLDILGYSELKGLTLQLSLIDLSNPAQAIYSQISQIGTNNDDSFSAPVGASHIDGREGYDVVTIDENAEDIIAERINTHLVTLESLDAKFQLVLEEIEGLQFRDRFYDVDSFLELMVDDETSLPNPLPSPSASPAITPAPLMPTPPTTFPTPNHLGSLSTTVGSVPSQALTASQPLSQSLSNVAIEARPATTHVTALASNSLNSSPAAGQQVEAKLDGSRPKAQERSEATTLAGVQNYAADHHEDAIEHEAESTLISHDENAVDRMIAANVTTQTLTSTAIANTTNFSGVQSQRLAADWTTTLGAARRIKFSSDEHVSIAASFDGHKLWESIDESPLDPEASAVKPLIVGSAIIVATGFSVAQIVWLLRGSVLVTKTLAAAPIWIAFDPLPILNPSRSANDRLSSSDRSESLLDIAQAR